MTENDVADIGSLLKAQRERLGYSLQDVAQNTRIRRIYLESIENNQFSELPGHAYVTGFVKTYARYLGAETDELLAQLEEIRLNETPPSLKPINSDMLHPDRLGNSTSKPRGGLVFGIITLLVLGGVIFFLTPALKNQQSTGSIDQKAPSTKPAPETGNLTTEADAGTTRTGEGIMPPSQEKEQLEAVAPKITERQPLPLIPAGGASLRMLALSEGSLIIYLDDRDSQSYELHNGFDSIWDVGKKVKVELSEPGIALFWLGEQKLDIGELNFFQLNTAPGD